MKLLNFLIPVFEANERMERSLRQLKFMITQATDLNMFKVKIKEIITEIGVSPVIEHFFNT